MYETTVIALSGPGLTYKTLRDAIYEAFQEWLAGNNVEVISIAISIQEVNGLLSILWNLVFFRWGIRSHGCMIVVFRKKE